MSSRSWCDGTASGIASNGARVGSELANFRALTLCGAILFAPHPDPPVSGGAFVRASVFRLERDFLATRWGGLGAPCGAEEG